MVVQCGTIIIEKMNKNYDDFVSLSKQGTT